MHPLVYADESQVQALFRQVSPRRWRFKGVAYEWRGEGVFHVFARTPAVAPSGYPLGCFFAFPPEGSQPEPTEARVVQEVRAELGSAGMPFRQAVLSVFHWRNGSLAPHACLCAPDRKVACDLRYVPAHSELYSRSRGLLEVEALERKRVVIVGLGSFGSQIAIELAKAGVGRFDLLDFDRLELANLARHTGRIQDLGRFKTRVVRDAILSKNPFCEVRTFEVDINRRLPLLRQRCAGADLVISVTDDNASRFNVNHFALQTGRTALFGRAITRAAGGDVLRARPGAGPCLSCLFGQGLLQTPAEVSTIEQARRDLPAYTAPDQLQATVQVGLSSDILPITNMMVKLALVALSEGTAAGMQSVAEDLVADFYLWVNRRDLIYRAWPRMEYFYNRNSILRWYGIRTQRDPACLVCGQLISG
ncbi:MAG: ThiF family adenylyltransferase [Verrucomicrobia bacterium]|nr:ThiF family adenylyltransferase [Verrucomicrobiota bacterium]